ncbi:MAG: DUF4091 domain-containing protein [Clostridia bacterium]|nr:DUF4091 domain-containing protein [Clostridia bacterium]
MKKRNIVSFILIAVMLAAVMFSSLSCDNNTPAATTQPATVKDTEGKTDPPDATVTEDKGTEPPTDAATEAPGTDKGAETDKQTDPHTTEAPETDKQTDPQTTEKETDPQTQPVTEQPSTEAPHTEPPHTDPPHTDPPHTDPPPTEPPTTEAPGPDPEPDNIFRTWNNSVKSTFKTPSKQMTASIGDGYAVFTYATGTGSKDPFITFDIAAYTKATGKPSLKGADGSYIVFKIRSVGGDGVFEVFTQKPAGGDSATANYIADGEWRYIVVDMTNTTLTKAANLTTIRLDWSGGDTTSKAYMHIAEIGFFDSKADAYDYAGYSEDQYADVKTSFTIPTGCEVEAYASSDNATLARKTVERAPALEITPTGTTVKLTINVNTLAALQNAHVKKGRYVTICYKTSLPTDANVMLQNITGLNGFFAKPQTRSAIDSANKSWQGAMLDTKGFDLTCDGMLNFTLVFTGVRSNVKIYVKTICVTDDINEALTTCGKSEYALNYDASLTDNDPLANRVLTAENEDSALSLWFDQSTQKVYKNNTVSTGRTGYTVRMAKNEAENCQFFIAPQKNVKVRVTVDEFKNSKGDTVQAELAYEYYHNINGEMIPDGLIELKDARDIAAGNSQGFVIRLTTTPDTPTGTYESLVHVYDDATGKEIKRAAVAVKVWDFALSEETELRTAFALWMSYVYDSYPSSRWSNEELSQLEDNYYQFFLKYRINIMDVPHGLTSSRGGQYMNNPRVNTARWSNLDMSIAEDNNGITPDWMHKVIYYPGELDEPRTSDQFAMMIDRAARIKQNTPDYRMVIPFERDLYLKADGTITTADKADFDSVGFLSQYVNIWCPKLDAFTPRDLGCISGASYLQSKEQDAKYGVFTDRMKNEVAGGDELWAYICVNPTEPYVNWQLLSDGTETIVSLWQMKQLNVTGMLYWAVDYWKVNYWGTAQPWTGGAFGDGILIYSGHTFGTLYPIPTMRLENIRDGIEDYQMLCMLEAKLGTKALNDMVSRITTSVLTYADNDDYIHAVRVLLGETLERELSK